MKTKTGSKTDGELHARPVPDERRRRLVVAATEQFLRKGYNATTMADVATHAGMSKKTVYKVFPGKTELFDAVLLDWFTPFAVLFESEGDARRDTLVDILIRLATMVLDERHLMMLRLLIAEAPRSEEIGAALERMRVVRGKNALRQWLSAQAACGSIRIDDVEEAASILFFAAAGEFLMGRLLRNRPKPTAEQIRSRVERSVAAFFDTAAMPPSKGAGFSRLASKPVPRIRRSG